MRWGIFFASIARKNLILKFNDNFFEYTCVYYLNINHNAHYCYGQINILPIYIKNIILIAIEYVK